MADELEENYVLDSDTEYAGEAGETVALEYDVEPVQGKRKREELDPAQEEQEEPVKDQAPAPGPTSTAERNKRKRLAKKARKQERMEAATGQEERLALLPPDVQAEHMRSLLTKAFPKKSNLELSEMEVAEGAYLPTAGLFRERQLDELVPLLTKLLPGLSLAGEEVQLLVVSGNANRCTDLARALRPLMPAPASQPQAQAPSQGRGKKAEGKKKGAGKERKEGKEGVIAKLFARHMKRSEQASLLRDKPTPIAVGTPGRIEALLEAQEGEATPPLTTARVRCVVLDASWKDAKQFTLLDSPDTKRDLFSLLAHPALRRKWGDTKLLLF